MGERYSKRGEVEAGMSKGEERSGGGEGRGERSG